MNKLKCKRLNKYFLDLVAKRNIKTVEILADIGCGIRPQNIISPRVHICCEPFFEYRDFLSSQLTNKMFADRSVIVLPLDWEQTLDFFPQGTIDTIFLLDVIEHLDKSTGLSLLVKSMSTVKHQIVIFTPLGFMPQTHESGVDAWGMNGGNWQEHKSGWQPEDFPDFDNWSFFISDNYHDVDHDGVKFPEPYGAFWAIYDKPQSIVRGRFAVFHKLAWTIKTYAKGLYLIARAVGLWLASKKM